MTEASTPAKTNGSIPHKVRTTVARGHGGRGGGAVHLNAHSTSRGGSKNRTWVAGRGSSAAPDGKWERGRGGSVARGRGSRGAATGVNGRLSNAASGSATAYITEDEEEAASEAGPSRQATPAPPTMNGARKTWEELVKAREAERVQAIREGKMDDPTKPKRLEEAITIVGTCQDMCPEFERYRRERENNLDKWECIIGPDGKPTKKVDHSRAVKIYERGQGDKIIPSDLRPAPVLKRTLDYLFHDLIPRGGFADTQAFVRDRSRAVRNDFTIQQDSRPIAIECHERCTRFHILSLHLMYDQPGFDRALEIQQLMNSLLSLKEFYDDQRGTYESPNELEMRIYHRLGLIRDQHERNDKPPPHIAADRAFQLITRFRNEVQVASMPITKTSKLKVNDAAMQTFSELAGVLRERRNIVMIYLVACFLEHIFGKDTIDDIEGIRGSLSIQDIIDGNSEAAGFIEEVDGNEDTDMTDELEAEQDDLSAFIGEDEATLEAGENGTDEAPQLNGGSEPFREPIFPQSQSAPALFPSSTLGGTISQPTSAPIPARDSVFGKLVNSSSSPSVFGQAGSSSVFGTAFNAFGSNPNVFGGPVFGTPSSSTASSPRQPVEQPKQTIFSQPLFSTQSPSIQPSPSIPPSQSTILQDSRPLRSLADAPALASGGEEDHVSRSEAVQTPEQQPPFFVPKTAPTLNAFTPSFEPGKLQALQSTPFSTTAPVPSASRSSLPPIRTDSPLNRVVDPLRGFATPVDSPSQSFLFSQQGPSKSGLSLDTGATAERPTESSKAPNLDSPIAPPALGRKAPISLPGTPTAPFASSAIPVEPTTPSTPYSFPALRVNISTTTTSTPNAIPSSSRLFENGILSPKPHQRSPPETAQAEARAKLHRPDVDGVAQYSSDDKKRLVEQADAFSRSHSHVPVIYKRWKQKMLTTKRWEDAVRRSEEYRQRMRESPSNGSMGSMGSMPSSSSFKRQRSNADVLTDTPKRVRRSHGRLSTPSDLRTDEELAGKLMKNRERHERRWARGLFTQAIKDYISSILDDIPADWAAWLCMNPDNDKTAIWLEQKFDVPQSGNWESESVFSIPIAGSPASKVFPGLIVFECTPLEEVDDEIEKKYRVLDDCSRLRDVISQLPENRPYKPTLLLINWDAKPGNDVHSDIFDMTTTYVQEEILRNTVKLTIDSCDDTDVVFARSLPRLYVDIQGDHVERLDLSDFYERLSEPWKDAANVWMAVCLSDKTMNWYLFSLVVETFVKSLNVLLKLLLSTRNGVPMLATLVPNPTFGTDGDNTLVLNILRDWLIALGITPDFSGLDEDDMSRKVVDYVHELGFLCAKQCADDPSRKIVITKKDLEDVTSKFLKSLKQMQDRLRSIYKEMPLPSPKRKTDGFAVNGHAPNEKVSQVSSLSPLNSSSVEARPAHISESFETLVDGHDLSQSSVAPASPSPSVATSLNSSVSGGVTTAMLRALSRDILKKYGNPKRKSRKS